MYLKQAIDIGTRGQVIELCKYSGPYPIHGTVHSYLNAYRISRERPEPLLMIRAVVPSRLFTGTATFRAAVLSALIIATDLGAVRLQGSRCLREGGHA